MSEMAAKIAESYNLRVVYDALLTNEWSRQGLYDVHKSFRHYDGERCFGDENWFIVVAILPTGQVSNHYHKDYWHLFRCPEVPIAKYPWDWHTSMDVVKRLIDLNIMEKKANV